MSEAPTANSEYVVVARRYRPQQFGELIGQEHVAAALSNAIETNRIGHAYLFTGARGVGKTSAARILAKALNCVHGPTPQPCGECEICRDISRGDDMDTIEIDGASNRGIDEIREIRHNVNMRPSRSRFKIYTIDEVHMLTPPAFNALLKTLEEPPEHVKFIFCTTEPNKIPITVLSRCQRFDFSGIHTESIERRLAQIVESEGLEAEDEALSILARRAGGSMRDSQSLLEQLLASCDEKLTAAHVHALLGTADDARLLELGGHVMRGDAAAALAVLDGALAAAIDIGQFLEQLLALFRDCMAAKVGCGDEQLLSFATSDGRQQVRDLAEGTSLETILAMLQILDQALARFRVTTQRRTLSEIAIVRLCNLGDLDELSHLIWQVNSGEPVSLTGGAVPRAERPASAPVATPQVDVSGNDTAGGDGGSLSAAFAARRPQETPQMGSGPGSSPESPASPPPEASLSPSAPQPSGPRAAVPRRPEPPRAEYSDYEASQVDGDDCATMVAAPPQEHRVKPAITERNCEAVWREATEAMGGLLSDAASKGRPAILAPNRLAVTFPHAYNKMVCEQAENLVKIRQALQEIGHGGVQIEFVVKEAPPETAPAAPAPERVSQHQKIFEAAEHPLVKKAEELFGAKIRQVD